MLVISLTVSSVSMGTAMRPKAVTENRATGQLGEFCESMATLSPALMPKFESSREMRRQVSLKEA